MPTPVMSPRRRDNRVHATETPLPAAQPVQSARASVPAPARRRRIAPWLLVSGAALVLVGVIIAGALATGLRDDAAVTASGSDPIIGRDALSAHCVPRALGESGERVDRCSETADAVVAPPRAPDAPAPDAVEEQDSAAEEGVRDDPATTIGATPDAASPSDESAGVPDDDAPASPPGSAAPAAPAVPSSPAPAPAPPAPAPPAPSPAARPLAFTGISENHAIGLLGIRILSSYTLSLSGQPGATASVVYDGATAGSVTFDAGGRARITLGGSLISAGLRDPVIRVSYTGGTVGADIQATRDSI
ncbi:hypothetical protein GCM10027421_11180 [Microbacterium shaanxiense]